MKTPVDSPDYSSGYKIEGEIGTPYTEYGGKDGFVVREKERGPLVRTVQKILRILFMVLCLIGFLFFSSPVRIAVFRLWARIYLIVFAGACLLTCLFSAGGENKPLQLWLTAAAFPAYLALMLVWLDRLSSAAGILKLVVLFFGIAGVAFFLDWRVSGRNAYPFFLLVPLFCIGAALPAVFTDTYPSFNVWASLVLMLLPVINASVSTLRHRNK